MEQMFVDQVEKNDLTNVRLSLSNELMRHPNGESFYEMLSFARDKLPNLFEEHDGKSYSKNEEDWNQDLFFSVRNDLDRNFSKERLELYIKMSRIVRKEKIERLKKKEDEEEKKMQRDSLSDSSKTNKKEKKSEEETNFGLKNAIWGAKNFFIQNKVVIYFWLKIAILGVGIAALIAIMIVGKTLSL